MNKETRTEKLEKCAGIETDTRVGAHMVIVPVKTKEGIFKELQPDGTIPGNYEDYSLQNLLDLGVNLPEMRLDNHYSELVKATVEKFAKNYLENLNNKENE